MPLEVLTKSAATMKKTIFILCSLIFTLGVDPLFMAAQCGDDRVVDLLSSVEMQKDLEDTIHSNPDFLDAVSLILRDAELKKMSKKEIRDYYLELLNKAKWTKWIPYLITEKVDKGLYLVSIGSAATTQPGGLYLFYGSSRVLIDRSDGGGTVSISTYKLEGKKLRVLYNPVPGATRPTKGIAYLENTENGWKLRVVVQRQE